MARFLRDEQLAGLTVTRDAIVQLDDVISNRGLSMPEYLAQQEGKLPNVSRYYTIRFDEKGNRVGDVKELLRYFELATHVERVVFELKSGESIQTNLVTGSYIDLRLDSNEVAMSFLTVSSDDEDWVNGTFTAIREVLSRHRNRNSWVRNPWVVFLNQVMAIFLGFAVSLWAASQISPSLTIENSFLISFLMVLLVFSNLWGFLRGKARDIILKTFPKIRFYRPNQDRLHWVYQSIIVAIVGASALYVLNLIFTYAGKILGSFVGTGT